MIFLILLRSILLTLKGQGIPFFKINIVLKWSMNKRFPMNTIINPVVKAVPPTFTDTDHSCRALLWI